MRIKHANRWIAAGTLSAMTLGSFAATITPAEAVSSKTWKKAAVVGAVVGGRLDPAEGVIGEVRGVGGAQRPGYGEEVAVGVALVGGFVAQRVG